MINIWPLIFFVNNTLIRTSAHGFIPISLLRNLSSSKKSSYFSLAWIWNQLGHKRTPRVEFQMIIVPMFWFFIFDIDCRPSRLEKAQSRYVYVRVHQIGYHVVDELHGNLFVDLYAEEQFISRLEYPLNLKPNCKQDHRENEGDEELTALTDSSALELLLNFC